MIRSQISVRLFALVSAQVLAVECATTGQAEFESADTLRPGIFLEPEERFVLPPGVEIRPVFRYRSHQDIGGISQHALQRCGRLLHDRIRSPDQESPL